MNEKLKDLIYSNSENIVNDLKALVETPSDNVHGDPKNALLKMRELCEAAGFKTTNYENAILCADFPGEIRAELGILAHLDTVPAQSENWDTDPFELVEKDGVLYGRGTIDDKGPAVSAFWALKAVKELNIPLKKGVRLIFGTDEENGSSDLEVYKKYDRFPENVFTPDGSFPVINIEKGMLRSRIKGKCGCKLISRLKGGNIPNAVPDKAEVDFIGISAEAVRAACQKLPCEFKVSEEISKVKVVCVGKAAHASTPESGKNAVTALLALAVSLGETDRAVCGLSGLFPPDECDGGSLGLKRSDASGGLTCVLSTLSFENGCLEGTVDIRFPTCAALSEVKETLSEKLKSFGIELEVLLGEEPHTVPESSEFVQRLLKVYEEVEGERGRCIAIGGGTYVHNIEGGVAFGAERGDTDYHMHGDNEFITRAELLKDAVLYAHAIIELCG